jgi:hypothetical protein
METCGVMFMDDKSHIFIYLPTLSFYKKFKVNYPAAELRGIKNQKLIVPGVDT